MYIKDDKKTKYKFINRIKDINIIYFICLT